MEISSVLGMTAIAVALLIGLGALGTAIGFGILGYFLRKLSIPTVPVILGILLGSHMEVSLRRAMVLSDGDWAYLFSSSIAIGLWAAAIIGFIAPLFLRQFINRLKPKKEPIE